MTKAISVSLTALLVVAVMGGCTTINVPASDEAPVTDTTTSPVAGSVPDATTMPASDVSSYFATLNGKVNPNNAQTEYWFEYGATANLGDRTTVGTVTKDVDGLDYDATVTVTTPVDLKQDSTYYFRLSAKNQFGTVNGDALSFKTQGSPTPNEDNPADWKIYSSAAYGFSIQYPSGYTFRERTEGESSNLVAVFGTQVPAEDYPMIVYIFPTEAEAQAATYGRVAGHVPGGYVVISAPKGIFDSVITTFKATTPESSWKTMYPAPGMTLQYPGSWEVHETTAGGAGTVEFTDPTDPTINANATVLAIKVSGNQGGITLDEWFQEIQKANVQWTKVSQITISGYTFYKITAPAAFVRYIGMVGESTTVQGGRTYQATMLDISARLPDAELQEIFDRMTITIVRAG